METEMQPLTSAYNEYICVNALHTLNKPLNGLMNRFSRTFDSLCWISAIFCWCCCCCCRIVRWLASASNELPTNSDINTIAINICLIIMAPFIRKRQILQQNFITNDVICDAKRKEETKSYDLNMQNTLFSVT